MAFEKITENVENISLLSDTPAMTSAELKAEFDKGNKIIKEKFNKLIDELNALAPFEGISLYDNSVGTIEAVPLSEDISNLKRLRISGHSVDGTNVTYFTQDVDVVLNQDIGLLFKGYRGGSYDYIVEENIKLTNTSITRGVQHRTGFLTQIGERTGMNVDNTSIYITKVIGFNY